MRKLTAALLVLAVACGSSHDQGPDANVAPNEAVRNAIARLEPSAGLGHRGTGLTREGHPFPENSVSSFEAAMQEGADGIELDVEITLDGKLIIMHDDTVNRTTTGPEQLVPLALEEVAIIGAENRTLFSSFDETAAELVKTERPGYYSALLSLVPGPDQVETALLLGLDAIHPFFSVSVDTVQAALDSGLQVNVWTVDGAEAMQDQIDKGSTGIITNEPAIFAEVIAR